MKNCKKIHPLLPLSAQTQRCAPQKAAVAKHLGDCSVAREELPQLQHLRQAMKAIPEPKMPHDLHDKIMARVHGKPAPVVNYFWLKTATWLAAAAGLAFIFFAQNFGWLNHSQVALKPSNSASLNSATGRPAESDISIKSAMSQPKQKSTSITIALSRPLDARVNLDAAKKVVGVEHSPQAFAPAAPEPIGQLSIATPPMVLALGGPQARNKAMVKNTSSAFQANALSAGSSSAPSAAPPADFGAMANDNGQAETKLGLNYQASLPDVMSAEPGDKQIPKFLRFDTFQIGLNKYQLNWQTDLVTKGQILILDSTGNTLQALSEKTDYAYDHQMVIDNTPANPGFLFKLVATYLNGNQAVTITQPLNPTPTP